EDIIVISSDKIERSGDWNSPEYQDTTGSKGRSNLAFDENMISNEYAVKLCLDYEVKKGEKLVKKELIVALKGELYFIKFIINLEEDDVEPGIILGRSFMRIAKGIVDFDNGVITIYPELNPFEEDYEHLTQEEAVKEALAIRISQKFALLEEARGRSNKRITGKALKEKDDPEAFIFPIRLEGKVNENALADTGSYLNTMSYRFYETLGREEMKKVDRGIKMINHTQATAMRILTNVLCQDVRRTSRKDAKSRYNTRLAQFLLRHIYSSCVVNWDVLNRMGCDGEIDDMLRIRLRKPRSNKEIFTSVAWIRAFNINEPIYAELCHDFYSTYEFDEVCVDDELQTKKIIKFRLGGRAHSLTLLEFARRLGLYQAVELDEEGFNVYFYGCLRSDEHFNTQEYWLSISQEENLSLCRSHTSTIKYLILRVIHKMITYGLCQRTTGYGIIQKNDLWLLSMFHARHQNRYANMAWLIARWMKRKGAGTQKESQICCGQFISKIARKSRVLTDDVIWSLSALIYCRDLDTTTLRELIDSESRLIP
nr:hypothetical protein [Tanacetum cinerariifolium]